MTLLQPRWWSTSYQTINRSPARSRQAGYRQRSRPCRYINLKIDVEGSSKSFLLFSPVSDSSSFAFDVSASLYILVPRQRETRRFSLVSAFSRTIVVRRRWQAQISTCQLFFVSCWVYLVNHLRLIWSHFLSTSVDQLLSLCRLMSLPEHV